MRLLLLEDDALLGEGLRDFLRAEGHVVEWCTSLSAAQALQDEPFDALLVDWQLPDGSGVEWVHARRALGDARPVLVLTARDRLADRVRGLDSGADDYLVKPFAPEEMLARLRAVLRRTSATTTAPRLDLGGVWVDLAGRGVWRAPEGSDDGTPERVELTAREWSVLEALARRAGRVVTKGELDRLVLGLDAQVQSNALEVHVSALRRKLGHDLIETVRGLGYRVPGPK
ncbi:MAG: response regulator transcription factor [Burkholderiales bacterium]|nr:response regulator transcription factor [Burkholderiales bacterium]